MDQLPISEKLNNYVCDLTSVVRHHIKDHISGDCGFAVILCIKSKLHSIPIISVENCDHRTLKSALKKILKDIDEKYGEDIAQETTKH